MWSVSRSNGFITYSSAPASSAARLIAVAPLAKQPQELHAAHHRHIPVEQDDVGHLGFAARQGLLTVAGFLDLELECLEDVPRNLPDHLGIIDDQTTLHVLGFPLPW